MKRSFNSWKALGKRVAVATAAISVLLIVPSVASAGITYTFYPSGSTGGCGAGATCGASDLNDLDHGFYYSWDLAGLQTIGSQGLVSASITFKNMVNWQAEANVLHLDLLDSANTSAGTNLAGGTSVTSANNGGGVTSVVRMASDNSSSTTTMTRESDLRKDAFDSANPLSSSTAINLSDRAFLASGQTTSDLQSRLLYPYLQQDVSGWSPTSLINPAGWTVNGYDYTYTFTGSNSGIVNGAVGTQLNSLFGFISNDGQIALAFDPDCHFFNDGVSFTLVTNGLTATSAVPEPASLLLLGTGLVVAGRFRRKTAKTTR